MNAHIERLQEPSAGAMADERSKENVRLRAALGAIAGFGSVSLSGRYEHELRDIIRSMTDCARDAFLGDQK